MARVFVSFLGAGNLKKTPGYENAQYGWDRHVARSRFVQAAAIACMGATAFDRIVVLCTRTSRDKHWELLRGELLALGCSPFAVLRPDTDIPEQMDAASQWSWFETLLGCVDRGDRVTFDFTHGMRSVPIVFSSAIGFLIRTKDIALEHVLYGWYVPGQPPDTVHPIVDLRDFYAINDWAEAVSRLTEDADARKLASLAGRGDIEALRGLGDADLVEAFEAMTDCIRNVDVNNIAARVEAALQCVDRHRQTAGGSARVLLDCVWSKFNGLAFDYPPTGRYDAGYFSTQLAIVDALLEHKLYMQAFTAMREMIASLGMLGVACKSMATSRGRAERMRLGETFVNMIQFPEDQWRFRHQPDSDVAQAFEALLPWYRELEKAKAIPVLKQVAERAEGKRTLLDYRNGFDHAWTSKAGAFPDIKERGAEYRHMLGEVVELCMRAHRASSSP